MQIVTKIDLDNAILSLQSGRKPWYFMIYMLSAPQPKHMNVTQTPHPSAPSQQGYEQLNVTARAKLFLMVQHPRISSLLVILHETD